MITRTTILVRARCEENDTAAAVENAIDKVLGLSPESNWITVEWQDGDLSIEINFDGDVAVAPYIEVLSSFLPFMVDNVDFDLRFMNKDRYEVRDQNGDVLSSSDSWGIASASFADWARGSDRSNEGAGIYDNRSGIMALTLLFDKDED